MISTNEVTMPVKHTESTDINKIYMEEISKLASSTEIPSVDRDEGTNVPVETTTENDPESNLSKIISVICIWC